MRKLTENIGWKLFSLAAAIGLWYFVAGETEVAVSMPVVVQYRNTPSDFEISGNHTDRIFMRVRGPRSRVSPEALAQTMLNFDLSGINKPGDQTITVTGRELGLPAGVHLVRVVPAQVHLRLDRRASKSVPVKVRITGAPPEGYRIAQQRIYPEYVQVTGPESQLSSLSSVMTDPINLGSSVGYTEFRVAVALESPELHIDSPQPISVEITIEKTPN